MTTNAKNLAKASILALDPSIFVRISKENWFSRCFLFLKMVLSHLSLVVFLKWLLLPLLCLGFGASTAQDCVLSLQREGIFTAVSRLGLLLPLFDHEVHCCSEIFSHCSEIGLCCNEHALPWLICLHPFWGFSTPFVHFLSFCNLHEKYIKLT